MVPLPSFSTPLAPSLCSSNTLPGAIDEPPSLINDNLYRDVSTGGGNAGILISHAAAIALDNDF